MMQVTPKRKPAEQDGEDINAEKTFDAFYLGNQTVEQTSGGHVVAQAITILEEERRRQMVAEQKKGSKANRKQSSGMGMPILSDT